MTTVGIILSAYNGEKYIEELIKSIMNSNFADFKIFVCDDQSKDSTVEIVKRLRETYDNRIELSINEQNLGSTHSFLSNLYRVNKNSPCSYYMFCDQDDIWLKDKINLSLKVMKRLENRRGEFEPLLVFNDAIIVDDNLSYIARSFYKTNKLKVHKTDFSHMLMENKCIGCTVMMNRALVNLLNEEYDDRIRYHDWWMALLASSFGHIRYIKTPTLLYRQTGSNQVGQTAFSDYVNERASKKEDIKVRLDKTYLQAQAFAKQYLTKLNKPKRRHLLSFLKIKSSGFFKKRGIIIKNRFYKSGLLRNIGLLFYV